MFGADVCVNTRMAPHAEGVVLTQPRIRKAAFVRGKTLLFRDATWDDAAFILALRTDEVKGRHLSQTPPSVSMQRAWLDQYAAQDHQAYFVIESAGEPVGTVRLYDAVGDSFCWGSWILQAGAPPTAGIESAMMVYTYAVEHLHFLRAHFDVRKGNVRVWRFHERLGAVRVRESQADFHYEISNQAIAQALSRYRKYLPGITLIGFG